MLYSSLLVSKTRLVDEKKEIEVRQLGEFLRRVVTSVAFINIEMYSTSQSTPETWLVGGLLEIQIVCVLLLVTARTRTNRDGQQYF